MHLSHIGEHLDTWYQLFDFDERVDTMFRPGLRVREGTQTVRAGPGGRRDSRADRAADFQPHRRRSATARAIQTASRLQADHVAADGTVYREGHRDPAPRRLQHARQPVLLERRPERDGMSEPPSAGVHFVVFNPTSDDFERVRLAMDGVLPGRRDARAPRRATAARASTRCSQTTHRQNFLVPPRRHRSLPARGDLRLAEERLRARRTTSGGTVFSSAVASSSETSTIVVAVERGHPAPRAARARGRPPSGRSASRARGRAASGVPPRWTWPSTVTRVS